MPVHDLPSHICPTFVLVQETVSGAFSPPSNLQLYTWAICGRHLHPGGGFRSVNDKFSLFASPCGWLRHDSMHHIHMIRRNTFIHLSQKKDGLEWHPVTCQASHLGCILHPPLSFVIPSISRRNFGRHAVIHGSERTELKGHHEPPVFRDVLVGWCPCWSDILLCLPFAVWVEKKGMGGRQHLSAFNFCIPFQPSLHGGPRQTIIVAEEAIFLRQAKFISSFNV